MPAARHLLTASAALAALALASCRREARNFRPSSPSARHVAFAREYQGNAYALSEGKRLYSAFNCNGCHAHGGGGMGPPLMDEKWIYGSAPEDIFKSIADGRPDGM